MHSRKHLGTFLAKTSLAIMMGVLCSAQSCTDTSVDTDGDGVPDTEDRCPSDPNKTEPGICGCNVPETDTDGDRAPDCIDQYPDDPNSIDELDDCNCGLDDEG